jgi:hypothetical protein
MTPREAAREAGQRTYSTDEPCKHGHNAPRYTSNGRCTVCSKASANKPKAWEPAREAASQSGATTYRSAKLCRRGHVDGTRYVSSGGCVACQKERREFAEARKPNSKRPARKRKAKPTPVVAQPAPSPAPTPAEERVTETEVGTITAHVELGTGIYARRRSWREYGYDIARMDEADTTIGKEILRVIDAETGELLYEAVTS